MQYTIKSLSEVIHKSRRLAWKITQRARFHNEHFCIISQNCIGGVMYHDLGLEFTSPFINCLVKGDNMVRLCSEPERYLSMKPCIERFEESLAYPRHPILRLGDVEVHFPHTDNGEQALAAWKRRVTRIPGGAKIIVATSWDLNEDLLAIEALRRLPLRKVIFVDRPELSGENCVLIPERLAIRNEEGAPNVLVASPDRPWQQVFEQCFDFVKWLNGASVSACTLLQD